MSEVRYQGNDAAMPRGRFSAAIPWVLVIAIAALVAGQLRLAEGQSAPAPVPVVANPKAKLMLGVTTVELARNSYAPWGRRGVQSVDEFERDAQAHVSVVLWYADWANVPRPDIGQLEAIASRAAVV